MKHFKRVLCMVLVVCLCLGVAQLSALAASSQVKYKVTGGYIYFNKSTGTITGCDKSVTKAVIPSKISGVTVKAIDYDVFFAHSKLQSVTIPKTVKTIPNDAFAACPRLTAIQVSSANPYFLSKGGVLFNKSASKLLQYPAGKTNSSYTIPNTVKTIDWNAFYKCANLKSVSIPNSVKSIEGYAFSQCSNLTKVVVPGSVKTIGTCAFFKCSGLTSVIMANGVKFLDYHAFANCSRLKSVTIPKTMATIEPFAFYNCSRLQNVYYLGDSFYWYSIDIGDYNDELWEADIYCDHEIPATKIALSHSAISVLVDGSYTLKATLAPTYTTDTVKWTSSDKSIATVSSKGVVTGKAPGTATITAKVGSKTITCKVTVKKLKPPASVKTVSAGYNSVKLTWKKSTGAAGYQIYRSASKNGTYKRIATINKGSTVSYTDSKAITGQIYYYKIRAFQTVGSAVKRSGYTAPASGRALLSKPKSLAAAKASATSVKTSWKQVPGASGYQLQMSTKSTTGFKTIKTIKSGKTLAYTASKLKKGQTYYFRIRSYRTVNGKNVFSGWSAVAKGKL